MNSQSEHKLKAYSIQNDRNNVINQIASLTHWRYGEFLPIYYGNYARYGANQNWMKQSKAKNGCGPTAAAQMMAYLARHNGTGANQTQFARNLYTGGMVSRNFIPYMETVYDHIKPDNSLGTYTLSQFYRGAESYAKSKGVNLWSYTINGDNLKNNIRFITNGLLNNSPVAMLTRLWPADSSIQWLANHWVTITHLFTKDGVYHVTVQRGNINASAEVNFNLWSNMKMHTGGMVYFFVKQ